ncbi:hypothetical protein RCL_jg16028.t1 [Rhizophagus clarus]|uniref:Uncharacterized protein n=1 Tax=Rhizophagus clarus TaxID=94130 RepID=A0A8H3LBG3_9GLOM|nr:hypothetical protein RCL_jg16028.t1 [Rhizophagus clarus]
MLVKLDGVVSRIEKIKVSITRKTEAVIRSEVNHRIRRLKNIGSVPGMSEIIRTSGHDVIKRRIIRNETLENRTRTREIPFVFQVFRKPVKRVKFRQPVLRYLDDASETARLHFNMWNFKANTSDLNGAQIRQFLQLECPWSLDMSIDCYFYGQRPELTLYYLWNLDPFVEPVPASLVQDKTVDDPTSTSEHLDAWELTNRSGCRTFMDLERGFGGCSLNLRTICVEFWFRDIGNGEF